MRNRLPLHALTLFLGLLNASLSLAQGAGPLVLEKEIALPGVEGRIDHFSVDVPNQRLFVAALENGSVEILDIRRGERTAEIKGLEEPQGVYYDFKTGRLYVATGGDGKLRIYDGNVPKQFGIAVVDRKKRAVVAKWGLGVQFGNYPMALDDTHKRLFVGCRLPAKLVVLDTTSGRIVASLSTIGDADDIFYDAGRRELSRCE